jgi:predicted dehydrogenase
MSFDVWSHSMPHIELYGSKGTMRIGDPNFFISPVCIKRRRAEEWHPMPLFDSLEEPYIAWMLNDNWHGNDNWRGIGVADMAAAIGEKRPHRASGDLALHVLEVMTRILESGETGVRLDITHQIQERRRGF